MLQETLVNLKSMQVSSAHLNTRLSPGIFESSASNFSFERPSIFEGQSLRDQHLHKNSLNLVVASLNNPTIQSSQWSAQAKLSGEITIDEINMKPFDKELLGLQNAIRHYDELAKLHVLNSLSDSKQERDLQMEMTQERRQEGNSSKHPFSFESKV